MLLWVLCVFMAAACSRTSFGRGDAIERFQTGGATEAEAQCMTEALIVLDQLHVADPLVRPDEVGVAALVIAGHSCVR